MRLPAIVYDCNQTMQLSFIRLFDCSSFVQYLYASVGIKIPRCTIEQVEKGKEVKLKNIQAGDLVFFKGTQGRYNKKHSNGIGHVGIFIGEGKIIHASGSRKKVVKDDLKKVIKKAEFRCVERILK